MDCRRLSRLLLVFAFFSATALLRAEGTMGVFEGTVVDSPDNQAAKDWLYVQGRNGSLRRVRLAGAKVTFDDAVPRRARSKRPEESLKSSARVRVTAQQDGDGEWRALNIVILAQSSGKPAKPPRAKPSSRPASGQTEVLTAKDTVSKAGMAASK